LLCRKEAIAKLKVAGGKRGGKKAAKLLAAGRKLEGKKKLKG
jgi:hypothetical protein